jgi:hypothetical protein
MDVSKMSDEQLRELEPGTVDTLIEKLPKYWTMAIASKRNSGKTYYISQLIKRLLKLKKVDIVLVMTNSFGLNKDYDFLPPGLVMRFSEKVLNSLWERQKKTPTKDRDHVLVVLDDVLSDKDAVRSEVVTRVYALGRHASLSICCASQVANHLLTPVMKQNSDFILWSRLNRTQLIHIWEATNGLSSKAFVRWAELFGGVHYNFCVFDNYTDKGAPEEYLSVVRADEEKPKPKV